MGKGAAPLLFIDKPWYQGLCLHACLTLSLAHQGRAWGKRTIGTNACLCEPYTSAGAFQVLTTFTSRAHVFVSLPWTAAHQCPFPSCHLNEKLRVCLVCSGQSLNLAKDGSLLITQATDGRSPSSRPGYTVRPPRIKGESVLLKSVT